MSQVHFALLLLPSPLALLTEPEAAAIPILSMCDWVPQRYIPSQFVPSIGRRCLGVQFPYIAQGIYAWMCVPPPCMMAKVSWGPDKRVRWGLSDQSVERPYYQPPQQQHSKVAVLCLMSRYNRWRCSREARQATEQQPVPACHPRLEKMSP